MISATHHFGHQGENSIRGWFADREGKLFTGSSEPCFVSTDQRDAARADIRKLGDGHRQDFLLFEGNAQTLRTVTRLQVVKDHRGLNLTFGTLAALMKYTVGSDAVSKSRPATKKVGYFVSEAPLLETIWQETGLAPASGTHSRTSWKPATTLPIPSSTRKTP